MATLSPQRRSRQPLSTIRKVPRGYMVALLVITMSVLAACGDDENGEVSAEFTGGGCVYSGPAEFELGDEFAGYAVPVVESGGYQPAFMNFIRDTEFREHLKRRGLNGRRALVFNRPVRAFQQRDRDAFTIQRQRQHHPDRAAAHDNNPFSRF